MQTLLNIAHMLLLDPAVNKAFVGLLMTIAGGVVARVGAVSRAKFNIDIDAQLNALLHAAIQRALLGKFANGASLPEAIASTVSSVMVTQPDAVDRFKFDSADGQAILTKIVTNTANAMVKPVR